MKKTGDCISGCREPEDTTAPIDGAELTAAMLAELPPELLKDLDRTTLVRQNFCGRSCIILRLNASANCLGNWGEGKDHGSGFKVHGSKVKKCGLTGFKILRLGKPKKKLMNIEH